MLLFATTATTGPSSVVHQAARMVAEAKLARREQFSATDATQLVQLNGEVNAANAQVPVTCPMLWIIASALSRSLPPGRRTSLAGCQARTLFEAANRSAGAGTNRSGGEICRSLSISVASTAPHFCTAPCAMHRVPPGACPYPHSRAYRRLRAGLFPSVSCCRSCWSIS